MAAYELRFIDSMGRVAGEPREIDGMGVERAHERGLEALMTRPDYIGFELRQDGRELRRFVRRPRDDN